MPLVTLEDVRVAVGGKVCEPAPADVFVGVDRGRSGGDKTVVTTLQQNDDGSMAVIHREIADTLVQTSGWETKRRPTVQEFVEFKEKYELARTVNAKLHDKVENLEKRLAAVPDGYGRPAIAGFVELRRALDLANEARDAYRAENEKLHKTVENLERRLAAVAGQLQDTGISGLRADVDKRVAEELARVTAERDSLKAKLSQLEQQMVQACAELEQHRSVGGVVDKVEEGVKKALSKIDPVRGCDECIAKIKADEQKLREGLVADLDLARSSRAAALAVADEEIAYLRSQLALAESKRKPARHRPGEMLTVGWDPEGLAD